ncbi:uncharacterized protein BDW47DRAFT_72966 [Aspergillus candidus]|uniref:Uncharacterized protein n=1 Tax=Aspergillus candidus TaxID=41067 RepID=A0A2I2F1Z5_ASPCN|nr:hypothetical protein BDW47DRAFT_72966 [Aspergillus candidus]PLB34654.1 hypothetical protein BDW47DRAFT_72966 [Aspergillus candidus]
MIPLATYVTAIYLSVPMSGVSVVSSICLAANPPGLLQRRALRCASGYVVVVRCQEGR